jgi:hypothetical protein
MGRRPSCGTPTDLARHEGTRGLLGGFLAYLGIALDRGRAASSPSSSSRFRSLCTDNYWWCSIIIRTKRWCSERAMPRWRRGKVKHVRSLVSRGRKKGSSKKRRGEEKKKRCDTLGLCHVGCARMAGHHNKRCFLVSWGEIARGMFFLAPGSPLVCVPLCLLPLCSLHACYQLLRYPISAISNLQGATAKTQRYWLIILTCSSYT